ncbi:MAG TPA: toprim domain-containing protein, partial [Acidobacteriaceae bacterium]|nr:toprim domain-containing protein [Acidobacteriaceae bacterium]
VPVWSALNTSLLAAWMPPAGVTRVLIFADHDANWAGHAAAYALAHRLALKGVACEVRMPPPGDWNDALLAHRSAA